ncbi:hypothetical protein GEMRC1_012178 [Eukaryota sp. GEM-RC1]
MPLCAHGHLACDQCASSLQNCHGFTKSSLKRLPNLHPVDHLHAIYDAGLCHQLNSDLCLANPLDSVEAEAGRVLYFQQSLLMLVKLHLLNRLCNSSLELDDLEPSLHVLRLSHMIKAIPTFFKKVGYVSYRFFESSSLAVTVLIQTHTFPVVLDDLLQLYSVASLFGADVRSVFFHVFDEFKAEDFLCYSHIISGLELKLKNYNDLEFLNKSSLFFPRLKQLHVQVEPSISITSLIERLRVNTAVTRVVLAKNSIGAEGARALADLLKVNTTITSVNLNDNSIGDEGVQVLSEALKMNHTLISIDLAENFIGAEGASALADALKVARINLSSVSLNDNSIGDEGVQVLSEALKINHTLVSIVLSENFIGAEGASALADALKVNTTVTSIKLYNNSIGDRGIIALSEALKVNSTIKTIDLEHNSIGDKGATALAEALKVNTSLTSVDLVQNSIGDKGATALAEALKVNTTITSVDLENNSIGDEGVSELAGALKVNSKVEISLPVL